MIALDTNVLIRFIVQDDADQAAAATKLLQAECSSEEPGFINAIVLSEFVWVLERSYGYTRAQIVPVVEGLLASSDLAFEHAACAWDSLQAYRNTNTGFVDLLIGRINHSHGCKVTKTFDRKAARSADFEAV